MGLLSFLSRKTRTNNQGNIGQLKTQPYNATVASLPPIRGTYPVAGNGPNNQEIIGELKAQPYDATVASLPPIRGTYPVAGNQRNPLEALHNTYPRLTEAQNEDGASYAHAPAPTVPRLRDDERKRPRTAPSTDNPWSARQVSDSMKEHPVPPVRRGPPYRLPNKEPEQADRLSKQRPPYRLPGKVPDPVVLGKPTPAFAHARSLSIQSNGSRRFVDLLDAQSSLHATDFHHRLQAAGARSYGEDVADRNIGENGIDLDSSEARAFYSSYSGTGTTRDLAEEPKLRSGKRHSPGPGLRTKSLTSDANGLYLSPAYGQPLLPADYQSNHATHRRKVSTTTKGDRRKSLPAYTASSHRKHVQAQEVDDPPESIQAKSRDPARSIKGKSKLQRPTSSKREPSTNKQLADGTKLGKDEIHDLGYSEKGVLPHSIPHQHKSPKSNRRESMAYTPKSAMNQTPSKQSSPQDMRSASPRRDAFAGISHQVRLQSPNGVQYHRRGNLGSTPETHDSSTSDLQFHASQQLRLNASNKRPDSGSGLAQEQLKHTAVLASSPARSLRRSEIEGSVAGRMSSLRQMSMDSTSASISSTSSNPFRPQSRHTANTSVDLAPFMKEGRMSPDSIGSISYRTASEFRVQSPLASASVASPSKSVGESNQSTAFNIDDYISSDDDSATPRRSRGEGEEQLLFSDSGYGFEGFLPGLDSWLDTPPPQLIPPLVKSMGGSIRGGYLSPISPEFDDLTVSRNVAPPSRPRVDHRQRHRRVRVPSHEYDGSDDAAISYREEEEGNESAEELSLDIPMTRRTTALRHRRPARHYTHEEAIEEERVFDKVDIDTAVRMRKEAKRQKRLSGVPIQARNARRKQKAEHLPPPIDSAGFDADIE
ncbi:hypothetical protein BJ170DRAFT_229793 [Xylariales sp. AK1849]|nr:hypothetical protein BJ170DRAFT_229793 [Xylariales sp. AK1849]